MPELTSNENERQRSLMPAERQDMILSLLTRQSSVTVSELATLLHTTEITVRRDLTVLAQAGLLKRVRGGAMSLSGTATPQPKTAQPAATAATQSQEPSDANTAANLDPPTSQRAGAVTPAAAGATPGSALPPTAPMQSLPLGATIGVMFPEPSFLWPSVVNHMQEAAGEAGMRIVTRESAYNLNIDETQILDELADEPGVCAIVCTPSVEESSVRTWQWIAESDIPVIVVERWHPTFSGCYADSIHTNHPYGARKAAMHFLERGHTRIGAAFSDTPTSDQIYAGWRQVLDESTQIECPFVLKDIQPYDTEGVQTVVEHILDTNVTAMFIHSDYLAIAVAQALEHAGRRVPEDVSMISVDGFAAVSSRPLTVLRSPAQEIAATAVSMVIDRLQRPDAPTRHIMFDLQLIDRGSVIDRCPQ